MDSQSQRWPRGVCAGPSAEDPPAESRQHQTCLEAAGAACGGSRRTFHRRRGCRTEAEVKETSLVESYAMQFKMLVPKNATLLL